MVCDTRAGGAVTSCRGALFAISMRACGRVLRAQGHSRERRVVKPRVDASDTSLVFRCRQDDPCSSLQAGFVIHVENGQLGLTGSTPKGSKIVALSADFEFVTRLRTTAVYNAAARKSKHDVFVPRNFKEVISHDEIRVRCE